MNGYLPCVHDHVDRTQLPVLGVQKVPNRQHVGGPAYAPVEAKQRLAIIVWNRNPRRVAKNIKVLHWFPSQTKLPRELYCICDVRGNRKETLMVLSAILLESP